MTCHNCKALTFIFVCDCVMFIQFVARMHLMQSSDFVILSD